jgi:hydrogenase expression/formation protein HypD
MFKGLDVYAKDLLGSIHGWDRIRFRGTYRWLASVSGLGRFLGANDILLKDFGRFAEGLTAKVRAWCERVAGQDGYMNDLEPYPANAMAVKQARLRGLENFAVLVSHVLVPPAMTAILESRLCQVQAFLAAGHVCAVMGYTEYEPIAAKYQVPIVVTGFEPLDLLEGILIATRQLEQGRAEVENQYARAVRRDGNPGAQRAIQRVFQITDRRWRGIGTIPTSGLALAPEFERFDAQVRFRVDESPAGEHPVCIAGQILTGTRTPLDCAGYGTACTPRTPIGAPMVSSEGTCAAYYSAGRQR